MALSPHTLRAVTLQETEDRDICLITLTHRKWTEPVRLSTDATTFLYNHPDSGEPIYGTVSRGETYLYAPMQAVLPNSADEQPPEARITFSNVGRVVTPYLMMVDQEYPRVTIEVVNSFDPDVVDVSYPEMDLSSATWDATTAEVSIINNVASNKPMPWLRFVPAYFPNLFST